MKNLSIEERLLLVTSFYKANGLYEHKSKLSLAKQAQLASDALIASRLIELINDIEKKSETIKKIDPSMIDNGIHLIETLRAGEDYLRLRKSHLLQRPDSADTVTYIKGRTEIKIREHSDEIIETLNSIRNWPVSESELSIERLEFAKHFLRAIHTGIMDQLEAAGEARIDSR